MREKRGQEGKNGFLILKGVEWKQNTNKKRGQQRNLKMRDRRLEGV